MSAGGGGPRKRVTVLGATGSVGQSVADLLERHPDRYAAEALVAGSDAAAIAAMARRLKARSAVLANPARERELRDMLAGSGIAVSAGEAAVIEAAQVPCDLVVGAIVGAAGLRPTLAAVQAGRDVALANKECLVCAGTAFMAAARASSARVLPLDSEHNALFQLVHDLPNNAIAALVLTASGGPFRTWERGRIKAATRADALKHPNWVMGAKITIDSASMMNKGLELIEAQHLFAVPPERLEVVVHPQSIVHGLARLVDGSVLAGLAAADMRIPVASCLAWPERLPTANPSLDLAKVGTLTFEEPDLDRFPALALAMRAAREGGASPTIMNAANEVAVAAFLEGRYAFGELPRVVEGAMDLVAGRERLREPSDADEALAIDHIGREAAREVLLTRV